MSTNDAFWVIDGKPVFENLNLSTEMKHRSSTNLIQRHTRIKFKEYRIQATCKVDQVIK